MKILYLYAELMGYQIPVFQEYVNGYKATVHVVHWDHKKLTPYTPPALSDIIYYKRTDYQSKKQLLKLAKSINPDIIYISGWMDKGYLYVAKKLKKLGIPVVSGSDTQWKGNIKQHIATLIFPLTIKSCFTHIWVAGPYQYEYARRLGFKKQEIIFNTLSANVSLFSKGNEFIASKIKSYPQKFLYVGNFRKIKGTDILVKAFIKYKEELKGTWGLVCAGNGELKHLLDYPGIEVIDFASQNKLVELTQKIGAFILPSRFDQWGLVIHEFACSGLPFLISENVGAASTFLIENYNGLTYRNNSSDALAEAMNVISKKSNSEILKMSVNSVTLSKRITPEIVAASFLSVLKK